MKVKCEVFTTRGCALDFINGNEISVISIGETRGYTERLRVAVYYTGEVRKR